MRKTGVKKHCIQGLVVTGALCCFSWGLAATTQGYVYDVNGNMIRGEGKFYEYNDANQLVKVRHGDQNGPVIIEYLYDYTGQRIRKIENGVTIYSIGKHAERQIAGSAQEDTSYYFANGERVAKKDSSGELSCYHEDHLGGTDGVTDTSGNVVENTKYYPFGEIREGGQEKYAYTGKEKDSLTDWYYYEARYYNPEFVHFTQADQVERDIYDPQNLNRYSYVQNNPIVYIDPTGKFQINFSNIANYTFSKLPLLAKNGGAQAAVGLEGLGVLADTANIVNDAAKGNTGKALYGTGELLITQSAKALSKTAGKSTGRFFAFADFLINIHDDMNSNGYDAKSIKEAFALRNIKETIKFVQKNPDYLLSSTAEAVTIMTGASWSALSFGMIDFNGKDIEKLSKYILKHEEAFNKAAKRNHEQRMKEYRKHNK